MLAIHPDIQPIYERLCRLIREAGGRPLLVGGCVRDVLLDLRPTDLDLEVYELAPQQLIDVLSSAFDIDLVGHSFGVIKLRAYPIDISLPRRESKVGLGHRGFEVLSDPWMSLEEAAARRDFTINAMAIDPATEELLDPFNGQRDLRSRVLRHTSHHFAEDPLRVLRGMQFISRLELTPAPETVALCRGLLHEYPTLTPERIWREWEKWAIESVHPSLGLRFLQEIGWTEMYPELVALQGCPQDPAWHPEGDVWTHTLLVVDQAARIAVREGLEGHDRAVLLLAALCHDLGKPTTTAVIDGHIRSPGHAERAEPLASFLERLGTPKDLTTRVMALARHHLSHLQFDGSPRHVRRLTRRLEDAGETLRMLARLVEADASGRPPLPRELPATMHRMLEVAGGLQLTEQGPRPILLGRHLIALGIPPGPRMGQMLKMAYEAQLDGAFSTPEEGIRWLNVPPVIDPG
ncbi:MAG TPA: HD domain-containing protein [Nitrospiraceae bacterium]|nr:HD domain-containing protein [Nitrospiraceae bacterium]